MGFGRTKGKVEDVVFVIWVSSPGRRMMKKLTLLPRVFLLCDVCDCDCLEMNWGIFSSTAPELVLRSGYTRW